MTKPVWEASLEEFRRAAASSEPTPAGVAIAAASASYALGLLTKVALVSGRHKESAAHAATLNSIAETAAAESKRMLEFAEQDIAAFKAYIATNRLPQSTNREIEARRRAILKAARRAIEIPLAAARSAAAGLKLCAGATVATRSSVLADLGAAASLLASAMHVFLMCADSNLRQLAPDSASFGEAFADRSDWENRANRNAEMVLKHVASALNSLPCESKSKS
jgi:formiminotetrahydrofolate cyclodeaminase